MSWYVVHTKENQLDEAINILQQYDIRIVVPKIEKWFSNSHTKEYVTSVWYSNCLFIKGNADVLTYCSEATVFGTCEKLSSNEDTIVDVMYLDSDVIRHSIGNITDSKLCISEGPLVGMESKIKKIDRHKKVAYMDMSLLGRDIRLPLEVISKS